MRIIPIDKNQMPYRAKIPIANGAFTVEFHYNTEMDSFTIDLELEGNKIIAGEPLLIGNPLFYDFPYLPTPPLPIIALATGEEPEKIGWQELGESVFLYLIGGD